MHLTLGLGKAGEDRYRLPLHSRVERGILDQGADRRPGAVAVATLRRVIVIMMVEFVMVMMMVRLALVVMTARRFGGDQEASACQTGGVAMANEADGGIRAETQRRDGALDRGPMLGNGVEQRGDKHVARPSAERIEMNVQPRLRRPSTFIVRQR